jgi:RHS repeat-associated protein
LTDDEGSVRQLVDNTGALQDTITYDGYGNVTAESNTSFGDRYKYTGREFDTETNLQYNHARYYDPKSGRWTSQDPLGFDAGDSNLYRYVRNGSTLADDPSGLAIDFRPGSTPGTTFTDKEKEQVTEIVARLKTAVGLATRALDDYGKDTAEGKLVTSLVNRWFSPGGNIADGQLEALKGLYTRIGKDLNGDVIMVKADLQSYYAAYLPNEIPVIVLGRKYFQVPPEDIAGRAYSEEMVRAASILHEFSHHEGTADYLAAKASVCYRPESMKGSDVPVTYYRWKKVGEEWEKQTVQLSVKQRLNHADSIAGFVIQYYYKDEFAISLDRVVEQIKESIKDSRSLPNRGPVEEDW